MKEKSDKLKAKLEHEIQKGNVSLSSSDVSDFSRPEGSSSEATQGTVAVPVAKQAEQDKLISAGAADSAAQAIDDAQQTVGAAVDLSESALHVSLDKIEITEQDRDSFLDALVSGERFVLAFELFNGRVTGSFRSRSQEESHAVITQINREVNDGGVNNMLDYSTRMRNMLLATQVVELNGDEYPELTKPLLPLVKGQAKEDDKPEITPPGWLNQINVWASKHEGLVAALYKELQVFERKYWTMVDNAKNQDFWSPAESTSE